jgi:hypothetical protein
VAIRDASAEEPAAYSFRILDERLSRAHLPLILGDACILEDLLAPRLRVPLPRVLSRVRGVRREKVEPLDHLLERVAVGETSAADADVLLETEVLDLVEDRLGVVLLRAPVLVGLDRPDVGGLRLHEVFDEGVGRGLMEWASERMQRDISKSN